VLAIVSVIAAVAATVVVLLPAYGEAQVDAGSYGNEHRFLLRPPAPVLLALVVPAWAVSVAGAVAGPLLLAHGRWVAGACVTAIGLPLAAQASHSLCRLAQRWLVFVPNGLVIHDHLTVSQPTPLSRRSIAALGPAPAGTVATDLTAQALGIALKVQLQEPVSAPVVTTRKQSEQQSISALMVSVSRPAAVMAEARSRGIALA